MARPRERTYSRYTVEAVELLGRLIRKARLQKRISAKDLAARANVSRGLLQRVEKGDPRCEIGVAFELAALLGGFVAQKRFVLCGLDDITIL